MKTKLSIIFISTMRQHKITSPCKQNKAPRRDRKGSCNKLYIKGRHKTQITIKRYKKWKIRDNILQNRTNKQCEGYPAQENGSNGGLNMDSDAYQIAIDSCCSYSIARNRKYYTGPMTPGNIKIQGLARGCAVKWEGIWKFEIEDENGITRAIKIPNTLYFKEAPYCLLSTQHWSQQSDNPSGTYCKVGHKFMELVWQNAIIQRKVKINTSNNCRIIWSVPGYRKYSKFMAMSGTTDKVNSIRDAGQLQHKVWYIN